uniref:non-specific serine/threonine protein kinase n=1 Tax=Leersia perrieri TaxID=77586 RepID=A0A0D9X0P5_9ORYZ
MDKVVKYLDGTLPTPKLSPTQVSYTMMQLMLQNEADTHCLQVWPSSSDTSVARHSSPQNYPMQVCQAAMLIVVFLAFIIHCLSVNSGAAAQPDGDGRFIHHGFAAANLTMDGLAAVTPSGLLALTNATYQAKGHAFHPAPLRFTTTPSATANASAATVRSFSTSFVFAIVSDDDPEHGSDHGLAFVITPTKNLATANAGQYLGLLNMTDDGKASNHVFAVELDTIMNAQFGDIDSNHVGVDVNSLTSTQAKTAGYYDNAGTFRSLQLNSQKPMQVWVDYDGHARQLNVTLAPAWESKPRRPLMSTAVELSTVMEELMYVGFSSATGVVFTHHYVLGWSFSFDGAAPTLNWSMLSMVPRLGPKHRSVKLTVVLPIGIVLFLVAIVLAVYFVRRWRRRYAEVREDWEVEFGPHRFVYKDLFHATEGFSDKNLLGAGGFGSVYKGVLRMPNLEIAVKRVSHDSKQGIREFIAEVVSIGRIQHRNIVQLLGYCRRKGELLLVYDYMPNGSLDRCLHVKGTSTTLCWPKRIHIIKGVASALSYLHKDWEKVVIHRDVKASNVLLDSEMNGRLGDFGLSRLHDHGADAKTTHVVGTMGYIAPELMHTGKATPLTDVFAFGVFLLEVACGRRPIGYNDINEILLIDRVLKHFCNGTILDAVDRRLAGRFSVEEASLVLKLGLVCSHPFPCARPSMDKVAKYLDGTLPAPELSPTHMSYNMMEFILQKGTGSCLPVLSSSADTNVESSANSISRFPESSSPQSLTRSFSDSHRHV